MAGVTVREARVTDVADVLRIAERGWNAAYGEILTQATIDAALREWYDADANRSQIEDDDVGYFVAERNDDVVGYASGGPADADDTATLGAIYVDPDYWNEGIGTALLSAFESFCRRRGYDSLRIRVLSDNVVARSFYRAHGYEPIEERETQLFGEVVGERVFLGRIE